MILNGAFSDVPSGATFFHASEVSPSWSKKLKRQEKLVGIYFTAINDMYFQLVRIIHC